MMKTLAKAAALATLTFFAVGCAEEPAEQSMPGATVAASCADADGDGYGLGCEAGPDCNDADASVFQGCSAAPACDDGEVKECKVYIDTGMEGVISCFNGVQMCDGGAWGDCVEAGEV